MLMKKRLVFLCILLLLFGFRLAFGLCKEFWFEDEMQVYLIGLKFYTSGNFPYFGPDIVYTHTQIPGALQGLVVGLPFFILHLPEAPYLLLNLLSMGALCLLALYFQKKFPQVPYWFTWLWLLSCPWTLNYSTHIINPSYVLFGSILFFIGFFESVPKLSIGFIKTRIAFFLMGFSLFWIYQFHMSWILLLPFIAMAFYLKRHELKSSILPFLIGSMLSAAFLIPTFWVYGFHSGSTSVSSNVVFNVDNIKEIFTVLTRFLSFASYELPRFLNMEGKSFFAFLMDYPFAAPFIAFVAFFGIVQVGYLIIAFFLKNSSKDFAWIKYITAIAIFITYLSFFFSVKGPSAHTYYILFPLAMMYSFYCWQELFSKRWFRILMMAMLLSGFITSGVVMHINYQKSSMYKNRSIPLKAIQAKDYKILGERRPYDKNP